MLTNQSVGQTFLDNSGNLINIFKECLQCCSGTRYYGHIEADPSDNFFAYNSKGQRLDHRGRVSKDNSFDLILGD